MKTVVCIKRLVADTRLYVQCYTFRWRLNGYWHQVEQGVKPCYGTVFRLPECQRLLDGCGPQKA